MEKGDKVTLRNGQIGTITKIGMGDFIGDPKPVYVQYITNGRVKQEIIMSDQLVERKQPLY